jgi:hypothetical protein
MMINTSDECLGCVILQQELKRAICELELVTETIRILREVVFNDDLEVIGSLKGGLSKKSERNSDLALDREKQIQVPINRNSETTKGYKTAFMDISGLYGKTTNGSQLPRKVNAVAAMANRLDEQSIKENADNCSSASTTMGIIPKHIPVIVNHDFTWRSNIVNDCDRQRQAEGINRKQRDRNRKETKKKKIILMGDSHMKGYASELLNQLDKKFEVMGMVLPGARLQNIVQLCDQEVNSLTKDDMVILWGGSNNVAKNDTMNGLRYLRKFINRKKNTNFTLITAPHRNDLSDHSCVNEEVKAYNRKMRKMMKSCENT